MKLNSTQINRFQHFIFHWWTTHRRDLPWRDTHDPYHILISEVMLQQTQVSRVLPKYEEFLYYFPDVYSLAQSTSAKVLKIWRGMGYNRRALYLKKTAETIVLKYHGEFPQIESELVKLPGVGIYTARAIMVFAYKTDIAMVDTNIRQIITHFFFKDLPQKEKDIQSVADLLVPKGKSWEWHQALMDYGAVELIKLKRPERLSRAKSRDGRKKTVPFKDSNRFYRGKIVDMLRQGPVDEKTLSIKMQSVIEGLIRDGLAQRSGGMLRLPR